MRAAATAAQRQPRRHSAYNPYAYSCTPVMRKHVDTDGQGEAPNIGGDAEDGDEHGEGHAGDEAGEGDGVHADDEDDD
eukprot:3467340-Prymnesium_polylepis.1